MKNIFNQIFIFIFLLTFVQVGNGQCKWTDLRADVTGNQELLDYFHSLPKADRLKEWKVLYDFPNIRTNISKLSSLKDDIAAVPELESYFAVNPNKLNQWIDFDDFFKSRDNSYWSQFNNPPTDLSIVRKNAIKALKEYPDEYVNALENLGVPVGGKSDLFTRHGVDYGDEFYDIINSFKNNNTFGLTDSEIYSVFGYTSNFFYGELNNWLREGINENLTQDISDLITSGLNKLPSWSGNIAYRGIKIKPPNVQQKIDDILTRYPEGTPVQHGEFISVGSTPEASFSNNSNVKIRMEIDLKSGTVAKDISALADGIKYRGNPLSELLFPPGTNLRVDVVTAPNSDGVISIFFTEL